MSMSNYIMYLRKSRADRDYAEESVELTLSRHRERLEELCRSMGIHCDTVLQEVVSGDSIAARPEMMKLLQLFESGSYEAVVCIDMDRLSRGSGADQALVINTFKYSDTKIITPAKTYDFALEVAEQFAELSLFMAKQEYRTITRRMLQGRLDSAKEGKWPTGGAAPYGYEIYKLKGQKGQSLRIVPEEAELVREIFQLYTEDELGSHKIATHFNSLGYHHREGKRWTSAHVERILSNPCYTGKLRYKRRQTVTAMESGKVVKRRTLNEAGQLVYDGLHEAIISEEIYRRAQEIRKQHAMPHLPGRWTLSHVFYKVLICSECGKPMAMQWDNQKHARITCRTKGCPCVGSEISLVEDRLMQALREYLANYTSDDAPAPQIREKMQGTVKSLSEQKKALQAKLERVRDAYENAVYDLSTFKLRSDSINAEIDNVSAEMDAATRQLEALERRQQDHVPGLKSLVDHYYELPDAAAKNAMLRALLEKVVYEKKKGGPTHADEFTLTVYPKISM